MTRAGRTGSVAGAAATVSRMSSDRSKQEAAAARKGCTSNQPGTEGPDRNSVAGHTAGRIASPDFRESEGE